MPKVKNLNDLFIAYKARYQIAAKSGVACESTPNYIIKTFGVAIGNDYRAAIAEKSERAWFGKYYTY